SIAVMTRIPRRSSTFGIGKEIGGAIYVHRSSENVLGQAIDVARSKLPANFTYEVVKLVPKTGVISFVSSPDFADADEPTVGEIVTVCPDGTIRRRAQRANPEIYHHKWLFVADDYPGFDVEKSKQRSEKWLRLQGVDTKRIGRKEYWETEVVPQIDAE